MGRMKPSPRFGGKKVPKMPDGCMEWSFAGCFFHFQSIFLGVSQNSGFSPQIIHFSLGFPLYKPSILGYPYFRKHPHIVIQPLNLEILDNLTCLDVSRVEIGIYGGEMLL